MPIIEKENELRTQCKISRDSGNFFFCFRWLLIWFKRELAFSDVMRLWEVLWTDAPCKNFHLLICAALINDQVWPLSKKFFFSHLTGGRKGSQGGEVWATPIFGKEGKEVCFQQTRNQGWRQLVVTVSWDLRALLGAPDGVLDFM